jgi:hypothetical protein
MLENVLAGWQLCFQTGNVLSGWKYARRLVNMHLLVNMYLAGKHAPAGKHA